MLQDNKNTLSAEQQAIINTWLSQYGPMVVEASAGSGKTRILTECVRSILSNPKEKFKVLCLTFTNRAAEEMKERLSNVSGIKDRAFIGTMHGFALEIIKSFRHEIGYENMPNIIERDSDKKEILKDFFLQNSVIASHFNSFSEKDEVEKQKLKFLNDCLIFISEEKRKLTIIPENSNEIEGWSELELFIFNEYNHRLKNQNLIDYDDILLLAWKILTERPNSKRIYQRLYKYILVDEAQDLNYAQYQLLKALCGDVISNVLLVGDGNQTIHGYAGASKDFMLKEFITDFSVRLESIKRLSYNYRSSSNVINAANLIIKNSGSVLNSYFAGEVKTFEFPDENSEAKWVIRKIKELLQKDSSEEYDGSLTLDKIAVLARNRFVFNALQNQLDTDDYLSKNYYVKKGTETLEPTSTFMKVFELGTRIISNNNGSVYLNQLLNILGLSNISVGTFANGLDLLHEIKHHINFKSKIIQASYDKLLFSWAAIENPNNVSKCFTDLKEFTKQLNNDNERALALFDIEEWETAWKKYIRNVSANNISFSDFRRYAAMGINTKSNQSGLTLATVHSVKGLEFYVVFLIGMSEGTFPDYRSLKGKPLEEERNNAYVAFTRAKRILYISYPKIKTLPWGSKRQDKSQFLKEFNIEFIK
jgi:DNA helicase II / ATP-dependent DNA helicase PcrA